MVGVVGLLVAMPSAFGGPVTLEGSGGCPGVVTAVYPKGLAGVKAKLTAAQTQALYLKETYRAICFALKSPVVLDDTLVIDNASGVPLIVYGLTVKGGTLLGNKPLVELKGSQPVVLQQAALDGAQRGVVMSSSGHAVVESTLTGTAGPETVGIDAEPVSNTTVQQVTIRNFDHGLRVGQNGSLLDQVQVLWDYIAGTPTPHGTIGISVSGAQTHMSAVTVNGYATGAQLQGEGHEVTGSQFDGAPAVSAAVTGAEAVLQANAAAQFIGQVGVVLQGNGHRMGGGAEQGNTLRHFQQGVLLDGSVLTVTHNTLQQLDTGLLGTPQTANVVVEPNTFAEVKVPVQMEATDPIGEVAESTAGEAVVSVGEAPVAATVFAAPADHDTAAEFTVGKSCTHMGEKGLPEKYQKCNAGNVVDGINVVVPSAWCLSKPGTIELVELVDAASPKLSGSCTYESAGTERWKLEAIAAVGEYLPQTTCLAICRDRLQDSSSAIESERQFALILSSAFANKTLTNFQLSTLPSIFLDIIETPLSPTTVILAPIGGAMAGSNGAESGVVGGDADAGPVEMLGPESGFEVEIPTTPDTATTPLSAGNDGGSAVIGVFAGGPEALSGDGTSLNELQGPSAADGNSLTNNAPTDPSAEGRPAFGGGSPSTPSLPPTIESPTPGTVDPTTRSGAILAGNQVDGSGGAATSPLSAAGCSLLIH
ncbi:MAG: hypothetical protein HY696_00035 [Deltaproteobacteria bacterium]|nr:hypothetical protein [Deltaproteobacteria bacterium]